MPWSKRIESIRQKLWGDPIQTNFDSEEFTRRANDVLLKNAMCERDQKLTSELLSVGCFAHFKKNEVIIQAGDTDDSVYFIVSGTTRVIINKNISTFRSAPAQVGEMSALEPEKERSATVVAHSREVVALKLDGNAFREIAERYPAAVDKLRAHMMGRHRELIAARKATIRSLVPLWLMISGVVALIAGLVTWFAVPGMWSMDARLVTSAGAMIGAFFLGIMLNPYFAWLRLTFMFGFAALGQVVLAQFVSLNLENGWGNLGLTIENGSGELNALTFLGCLVMCGGFAILHQRNLEKPAA